LVLVGAGLSNEKEVEARIQDLARPVENIFLIEHHDGLERAPYYRASDIFVLPGVLEGEPSVLCEAMACGLPVAASRIAGHLNLVREGRTGLLFAPDNERNMASCLRRLVQDDAFHGVDFGAPGLALDHAAVECHDLEWAEDFYVKVLGLAVEHRVGWRTADYVRGQLWGEGKEDMAPGTRRWDQRYTVMEQKRRIPRPNTHFFLRVGDGVLGIYLATQHRQEPPEEQIVGAPRIGLRVSRSRLDEALKLLKERRFLFHGPVEHPVSSPIAASVYVRDPGANFLELCVPREGGATWKINDRE
jgi:catechol 2,3-dioxygenase-like lactoylglutathione lyase family enzyme